MYLLQQENRCPHENQATLESYEPPLWKQPKQGPAGRNATQNAPPTRRRAGLRRLDAAQDFPDKRTPFFYVMGARWCKVYALSGSNRRSGLDPGTSLVKPRRRDFDLAKNRNWQRILFHHVRSDATTFASLRQVRRHLCCARVRRPRTASKRKANLHAQKCNHSRYAADLS